MCGISDESIQRRLVAETALTFKKALELTQGMETVVKDVQEMQGIPQPSAEQSAEEVHAVSIKKTFACYRCGQNGHGPAHCTFRTAQCRKYGKFGHIKKCVSLRRPQGMGALQIPEIVDNSPHKQHRVVTPDL